MGSDWDGIGFGKGLKASQNQSLQIKAFLEYSTFQHLLPILSGHGILTSYNQSLQAEMLLEYSTFDNLLLMQSGHGT